MSTVERKVKPDRKPRMGSSPPSALVPAAHQSAVKKQERSRWVFPALPHRLAASVYRLARPQVTPMVRPLSLFLTAVLIRSIFPSFLSLWPSPSLKPPQPSSSSYLFRLPSKPPSRPATPKIPIVTTIFPLQEFARAVAGEKGEVSLLLPPGAGVHTWQPSSSDIRRLHGARLLITIGAGLEPWVDDILRSLPPPGPKVLAAAEILPLIEEKDEHEALEASQARASHSLHGRDPHVWLDFDLAQRIVQQIARALSEIDPASAPFYEANAASYCTKLSELDRKFEATLASCRNRVLLVAGHAAFGYLTRRYGLEQVSLYGLSPDAEPTPSRLMAAIRKAKELGIKAVFVEANTSPRLARTLAREIGAEILTLNPGASPTRQQLSSRATFFDIMEENRKAMRRGLGCD